MQTAESQKDNCDDNGESEMRGSLHCATNDETVPRSGRDDEVWVRTC
jgi:hypothetical protein